MFIFNAVEGFIDVVYLISGDDHNITQESEFYRDFLETFFEANIKL